MKAEDTSIKLASEQAAVAASGLKSLVPIEGRPFLDYVLSSLADAGASDMCLVIGPEHDIIRDRYTRLHPPQRFRVAFAIQEHPRGTADAVRAAEGFAGGEEFLLVNSDNYYPLSALRSLIGLGRPGTVLFTAEGLTAHSNLEPERIRAFALARVGADGCLDGLIEKPDEASMRAMSGRVLVSMNCWRFPPAIFEACGAIAPSARGEFEIADAVTALIARGHRLAVLLSEEGVLDLSRRGDIGPVLERLKGTQVAL